MNSFFARHARRILALGLIACLYLLARLPELSNSERAQLAARFRFEKSVLPEVPGPEQRSVRPVNPSLRRISSWISSVGAAVALNDLDGDGLPNDVCYVDARTDQVIVAPVPGTPARYQPFVLNPAPLPFDRDTMAPMGCLPGDMDEDGRMDILVYYWGRSPIAFLRRGAPMNAAAYTPVEIDNPRRALVHQCRHLRRPGWRRPRRPDCRQLLPRWRPRSGCPRHQSRTDAALHVAGL
jgi:enediyne biosynthesis protein E4